MTRCKILLVTLFMVLAVPNIALADDGYTIAYSESIQDLRVTSAGAIAQKSDDRAASTARALHFSGLDRTFDLTLTPNLALTRHGEARTKAAAEQVFRGTLNNEPGSWARISLVKGHPQGLIWDGQTMYALDMKPATTDSPATSTIFRLKDVHFHAGAMRCPDLSHAHTGTALIRSLKPVSPNEPLEAAGANSEIQVGMISDNLFTAVNGSGVESAIVSRMNIVDGIFSEQVGVQLTIASITAYDAGNDPFSDTTVPRDLLDELSDFRGNDTQQRSFGLTHLFTGRNLDGNTVGIAWRRALCRQSFGAGLTQATRSVSVDAVIAAHEIGHNFGAPHDGEDGSVCEAEPETFLMAPRVNNSQTLSGCSLQQISSHVNQSSCITPLALDEISITADSPDRDTLLGDTVETRFTAINAGADSLSNVTVSVEIPTNATLANVSASAGSCNVAAGIGTCTLASLAQGSGVTITATATSTQTGQAEVIASVSADGDTNTTNNQARTQYDVQRAVDLSVRLPASLNVALDGSAVLSVSVSNLASVSASDIDVSITPDSAGVRVSAATWPEGSCAISAGTANCSAANFSANQSASIQVEITGAQTGTNGVLATVGTSDTDRDTANNSASTDVTVSETATPPPAPTPNPTTGSDSDSGGGATGMIALLSLFGLFVHRRRRHH
ncbi:MAG: M12 family metallo-peptidase [Pseudomonadota bacterium]